MSDARRDPKLRARRLELYAKAQRRYRKIFKRTLRQRAPLTAENVDDVDRELRLAEHLIADALARELNKLTPFVCGRYSFVRQTGATCMSTSLANGLIVLGESYFDDQRVERVHDFTRLIVESTSGMGKPDDYRSVDDMHKFLRDHEDVLNRRYRCVLTNSLIDVVTALHDASGQVIVQQYAHARLAYELTLESGELCVRQRDPFGSSGNDQHELIPLLRWAETFLWSALKKIPTTMGRGFESLGAKEAREHISRYSEMNNLGLECISAILVRRD